MHDIWAKEADASVVGVNPQSPFLGIHAVNVFVRHQDQSLRFYVDQLGFDLAFDARLESGDRWVAVAPPDGSAVLALIAPPPHSRQYKLIGRATGIVFVAEDVVAKFEEWRKRGVRFLNTPRLRRVKYERHPVAPRSREGSAGGAEQSVWGGIFTRFEDLDGNSFSLVGFDEVNRTIEAQRRLAAQKLESERRAAQELEIAKQVQARLFPQRLPPMQTLEYAGACIQAHQVGGDYHDFLDLGRGRFGLVIGDISGKGIAAALLMANLQANLRSLCAIARDEPERLLRSVNQLFYENTSESAYATLFFAEYDDKLRRLRYANCGHLAALLFRRDGTIEKLDSTCTVLGLFKEWDCSIIERGLFSGDTLVLYTDGITESFNHAGEEFGEQRLIEALQRHRELPPPALIASVVSEVQEFSAKEQHDDITLIVAKCHADERQRALDLGPSI
ncbi:MAG TPA: SpoIIE family protein phosphatase [Terriglobia bacterium]|nr:SpoIIE family protein phosphatase [Terriglobia bacterium]